MKMNYELLQVKVISLANEDVITLSGSATKGNNFVGGFFGGSGDQANRTQDSFELGE